MQLHTRVIIKARQIGKPYWEREEDFGIPYTPDRSEARANPKVVERVTKLEKLYGFVYVDFRDAN